MNRRLFLCLMLVLLLTVCASGQESPRDISNSGELLQRIKKWETAVREAESAHAGDVALAKMYSDLASLYESAARYEQSEEAYKRAISLFRCSPESRNQLADDLDDLGLLHVEMNKMRQARGEELEALQLRQSLRDSLGTARSENSLAGFYFKEGKYAMSRDFARRAVEEFSVDERASLADRISSRYKLGLTLCYLKNCSSAIPQLKEGIAIARAGFDEDDFPVGLGEFFLGFVEVGERVGGRSFDGAGNRHYEETIASGASGLSQYTKAVRLVSP